MGQRGRPRGARSGPALPPQRPWDSVARHSRRGRARSSRCCTAIFWPIWPSGAPCATRRRSMPACATGAPRRARLGRPDQADAVGLCRGAPPAAGAGASGPARIVAAPAAAFIDAPTHGQAGAQLQSYFARLATEQNATVALSGVEAATREAPDDVLVQATLEISLDALQALIPERPT